MPNVELRLSKDMLVVAPLLTAPLVDPDMEATESLEFLNILDADLISEAHRRFRMCGAQCVLTNTRKANRQALAAHGLESALVDINRAGIRLAREAGFEHIFAVVESAPVDVLQEQLDILLKEEPDAIMVVNSETEGTFLSVSSLETDRNVPSVSPRHVPIVLPTGGDVDYSMGLSEQESLKWLEQKRGEGKPLMVCPRVNTYVEGSGKQRDLALSRAADELVDFALAAREVGASLVGTAPGTPPPFTGALYAALGGLDAIQDCQGDV